MSCDTFPLSTPFLKGVMGSDISPFFLLELADITSELVLGSCPVFFEVMAATNGGGPTRRTRSMKRTFVLLRFCDSLRVPRPNIARTIESSGRSIDLEFANNATTATIQDMLVHKLQPHLNRADASR